MHELMHRRIVRAGLSPSTIRPCIKGWFYADSRRCRAPSLRPCLSNRTFGSVATGPPPSKFAEFQAPFGEAAKPRGITIWSGRPGRLAWPLSFAIIITLSAALWAAIILGVRALIWINLCRNPFQERASSRFTRSRSAAWS